MINAETSSAVPHRCNGVASFELKINIDGSNDASEK
jgi:hypothetical protein